MSVPGLDPENLFKVAHGAGQHVRRGGRRCAARVRDFSITFVEHGGNTFDAAYVYGAGQGEKMLGEWMRQRGNRKDMIVIAKGAHTPFCEPKYLRSQFLESLDRLQTDYADIYMMHRDNLEIPVGEFVDAMNEQVTGRADEDFRRLELEHRTDRRGECAAPQKRACKASAR